MTGASTFPDNTETYTSRHAYCVTCGVRLDGSEGPHRPSCPTTGPVAIESAGRIVDIRPARSTATRRRSRAAVTGWEGRRDEAAPLLAAITDAARELEARRLTLNVYLAALGDPRYDEAAVNAALDATRADRQQARTDLNAAKAAAEGVAIPGSWVEAAESAGRFDAQDAARQAGLSA